MCGDVAGAVALAVALVAALVAGPGCDVKEDTGPATAGHDVEAPASLPGTEAETGAPKPSDGEEQPPPKPREFDPHEWIEARTPGDPLLCYLLGARPESMLPLGGTFLDRTKLARKAEKVKKVKRTKKGAPVEVERPDPELARKLEALRLARAKKCALTCEGPVVNTPSGARVSDGGKLFSRYAGKVLAALLRKKDGLSIEAVVTPADTGHGGPARVVGLSQDGQVRNFTLGQQGAQWVVRLRTSASDPNGTRPELRFDGLEARRTHVAFTYDGRESRFYIDGELKSTRNDLRGNFREWDGSFPLVLGNEFAERRDWAGVIRFVAFYDRALDEGEVRAAAADLPADDRAGVAVPADPIGPSRVPGDVPADDDEVF